MLNVPVTLDHAPTNRRRATRQAPNRAELAFYGPRLAKAVIKPSVFHSGIDPACPEALTDGPARAHSGLGIVPSMPDNVKSCSVWTEPWTASVTA
jgi:hypothetical protein